MSCLNSFSGGLIFLYYLMWFCQDHSNLYSGHLSWRLNLDITIEKPKKMFLRFLKGMEPFLPK